MAKPTGMVGYPTIYYANHQNIHYFVDAIVHYNGLIT